MEPVAAIHPTKEEVHLELRQQKQQPGQPFQRRVTKLYNTIEIKEEDNR